jgi:phage terminase large subunit
MDRDGLQDFKGLNIEQKQELLQLLLRKHRLLMPDKMRAFMKPCRYKFAYGGRGGGKSESAQKLALYRGNEEKTRAMFVREIQNSIADSVHSSLKDLITQLDYTGYVANDRNIINSNTSTNFIFKGMYQEAKKQTVKSYANIDLCIVEEAQSISKETIDLLVPTIRKDNSEIWFLFNRLFPDDPVFRFMQSLPHDQKIVVNINYNDNPFLPKPLIDAAELSKQRYEEGISDDYLHIWLGEPVGESDCTVFSVKEIMDAVAREPDTEGAVQVGVDVARYGNDRTTMFKRKGMAVVETQIFTKLSVPQVAREVVKITGNNITIPVKVDDTGLGGGVTDLLQEWGFNAVGVNFGGSAKQKDLYNNTISEMWFNFKDIIDKVSIPDDTELKSELMTREWHLDNRGKRCIETKDNYKKRGFRSPDKADGLLLAFYEPDAGAHFYF